MNNFFCEEACILIFASKHKRGSYKSESYMEMIVMYTCKCKTSHKVSLKWWHCVNRCCCVTMRMGSTIWVSFGCWVVIQLCFSVFFPGSCHNAINVVGEESASLGLLSLELRCTWLAQEGPPVRGVSPVWPSIMDSKPKLKMTPLEGVVIETPRASVTGERVTVVRRGRDKVFGLVVLVLKVDCGKTTADEVTIISGLSVFTTGTCPFFLAWHSGLWACRRNSNCSFCCCRLEISFSSADCSSSNSSVCCNDKKVKPYIRHHSSNRNSDKGHTSQPRTTLNRHVTLQCLLVLFMLEKAHCLVDWPSMAL